MRVVYSALARDDLTNVWLWIAQRTGVRTADAVLARIEHRLEILASQPMMGPARPDIGDGARHLVCERWLALYRARTDVVEVVRVVDAAQDLKRLSLDNPSAAS